MLIGTYNYYLQMIRDVTGLNEARDGSMPDKNALVGVQKLAAANSNTATRHILQSGLYLTAEIAECLSLRISDILEYSPTKDAFVKSIGAHNVATLEEVKDLYLYDFGIFIDLQPDEEEKDRQLQLENIEAQTKSNTQAAEQAAQVEMQKNQALTSSKAELANIENQLEMKRMQQEVEFKKELMAVEFQYNMQLQQIENQVVDGKEKMKEDRKDERTKIQATQQSEMIEQRNSGKPPKNFESAGNDTLGGGFDLGSFDPR